MGERKDTEAQNKGRKELKEKRRRETGGKRKKNEAR